MMSEGKKESSTIVEKPQKATDVNVKTTPGEAVSGDREIGGPEGPEPTRYGDWEKKGRCIDF